MLRIASAAICESLPNLQIMYMFTLGSLGRNSFGLVTSTLSGMSDGFNHPNLPLKHRISNALVKPGI